MHQQIQTTKQKNSTKYTTTNTHTHNNRQKVPTYRAGDTDKVWG